MALRLKKASASFLMLGLAVMGCTWAAPANSALITGRAEGQWADDPEFPHLLGFFNTEDTFTLDYAFDETDFYCGMLSPEECEESLQSTKIWNLKSATFRFGSYVHHFNFGIPDPIFGEPTTSGLLVHTKKSDLIGNYAEVILSLVDDFPRPPRPYKRPAYAFLFGFIGGFDSDGNLLYGGGGRGKAYNPDLDEFGIASSTTRFRISDSLTDRHIAESVPTPAALPGLIGMGIAMLRKRNSNKAIE
ncbi:PTPA-CTERM sorting domain-containing protein [Thermoleptolyngbya sp. C42_A2020_037]|uniref:PTPA-CTERM sorting domain-containing protein n=1 Tax=Thermoleptolyngbya sp. C42_A2020_037 TaxID=2747799 RepID=UPI0019D909ED|nr:PTPA-CTERM sorting domain-containing protein [Thermoleptolyngbya sp. C42_A2020_037]MBF2085061.1 PTPA-CTERM sorting domain-containing protein [Thermoleptolyngbya sp. C42_A2020_037]